MKTAVSGVVKERGGLLVFCRVPTFVSYLSPLLWAVPYLIQLSCWVSLSATDARIPAEVWRPCFARTGRIETVRALIPTLMMNGPRTIAYFPVVLLAGLVSVSIHRVGFICPERYLSAST